jgi:hypothetical protein
MSARSRVAIFAADVVGYCRLMRVDEVATLKMHRRWVVDPACGHTDRRDQIQRAAPQLSAEQQRGV